MRNLLLTITSVIWARLGFGCNTCKSHLPLYCRSESRASRERPGSEGPRRGWKCEQAPSWPSDLCRWLPLSGTQFLYL